MTRVLISPAAPSSDVSASASQFSITTSVVAFTPPTDDDSVISDDSTVPGIPTPSIGSVPQAPSVASIDTFHQSFTYRSPSPVGAPVVDESDVPVPSVEVDPLAGMLASQESFESVFAWRSPSPGTPSISLSQPPSSTMFSNGGLGRPLTTPRTRSRSRGESAPGRSPAIHGQMRGLRLSESAASSNGGTSTSSPCPDTPGTATMDGEAMRSRDLSAQGSTTPITTDAESSVSPPAENRIVTPGAFDLTGMQTALDEGVSRDPVIPRPSAERQHLSPTPTPGEVWQRRRRSSSAVLQPRHEVSDEEPPANRFHQPEFQQAFRDAKQLMADLSNVLASNRLHNVPDATMKKLYEEAKQLTDYACHDTRTVGFVGDTGVGKSSLINSLLDIEGLAWTGASGQSCTCVVTEYSYRPDPGFEVEVDYFAKETLEERLSDHLKSYRHYHLSIGELENYEIEPAKKLAKVAEDTLRAMFPVQLADIENTLLSDEGEEAVLRKLVSWVDKVPHSTTENESFADAQLCASRLMELTSGSGPANETTLWPFIHKIRVYCNAHILSKGLILVDLPGLRDVDAARRAVTERYIRDCNEIFAVCRIMRAVADESVVDVINLAKKADLSNVGIVCTMSDDINPEEARRDPHVEPIEEALTAARQNQQTLEKELAEFDEDDPEELVEEEKDAIIRVRRRIKAAERVVKQGEFKLKSYLIRSRNDNIRQKLQELYAERIPGDVLSVFCVGNHGYWEHRQRPKDVSTKFLELSCIIDLRKHCISIVAESQLSAATSYMDRDIPSLLDSLRLWVQSGSGSLSADRKMAIRDTLDNAERILRMGLTNQNSDLNRPTIEPLFRSFLAEYQHKDIWAQEAANTSDDWGRWQHGTYAAFCRKFGSHAPNYGPLYNWNEEVIESMVRTLSPKWRNMCLQIQSQNSNATSVLETLFEEVSGILDSEEALDDQQHYVLTDSLRIHRSLLESTFEESYGVFRRELASLKTDVLSGIRTSFIGQAMDSAYEACNREGGTGSHSRREAIISRRLYGEDIFTEMEMQLRARFRTVANELMRRQFQETRTQFESIKEKLDMLKDENVILEAESDPEFRMKVDDEVRRVQDRLEGLLAHL